MSQTENTRCLKVALGVAGANAAECLAGGFLGVGYGMKQDLTNDLPDSWTTFNQQFIPVWLAQNPGKSKVTAGLYCAALWTIAKSLEVGDRVLAADGIGNYRAGEVTGGYQYVPDGSLPHRRPVQWLDVKIPRLSMSEGLRRAVGAGIVSTLTPYADEIEGLIGGEGKAPIVATDAAIEDAATFALEKHLEDFLVQNWANTELGKDYTIVEADGQKVGQQYPTDTGQIEILAVRKDASELLVVELKRGRASDIVVGQVLRQRATRRASARSCPRPWPRPSWTGCSITPTWCSPRAPATGSPRRPPARG